MTYRAIVDPTRWVASTSTETDVLYPASQVLTDGSVTLAKQANMATASVVYRKTAGSGPPEVQTLATLKTDLGLTGTNSGDQDLSGLAPKASPQFSGNVGIGVAGTVPLDVAAPSGSRQIGIRLASSSGGFIQMTDSGAKDWCFGLLDASSALCWVEDREPSSNGTERMRLAAGGLLGIGTTAPTSALHVVGLPVFANNAAAVTGGLTAGAFYRTGGDPDLVCVVH